MSTQDLANKTFIVTGANTGIGKVTATDFARRGATVVFACRSEDKTKPVMDEIAKEVPGAKLEFVALDLGDLASVRAAAEQILKAHKTIDGLVNNAGLAGKRGLTKDGFELTWGTNHVGPYLFTRLLLDRIAATPGSRIVNVSSKSHYSAKKIDWDHLKEKTRTRTGLDEYAQSKLANVLFTKELAKRLEGRVSTYALHPGVVATDVWRQVPSPVRWVMKKFMITPEQGAVASIKCATDPAFGKETGKYYDVGGVERAPSKLAQDAALATELWQKSAEWTGLPA
ncbi:MAG TPA: SDR family oxidoreductase [Kofleriaceae bacterium]|jgi:dehydrogenase/reductase SDR family protein 13